MNYPTGIRSGASVPAAFGIIAVMAALLGPSPARACTTPVYRVAMYDWVTAPYHVFYFYRGQVPKEDEKVNRQISESAEGKTPANVTLHAVDLADQKKFEELPKLVREACKADQKGDQPLYLVYSAWGAKLFAGRLDAAEVARLTDSPKRTKLAELLDAGNATVLLVLAGPDKTESEKAENEKAEKAVAEMVAQVKTGKVLADLDAPAPAPADYLPETPQGAAKDKEQKPQKPKTPTLKVASLTVSRTDPAEQWFVRMLMAVEPDLDEYAGKPMVFPVYGRARALEPFIGDGIKPDMLVRAVEFVAGACSCTIKEQNPGMDLLVRWDWNATAEKMAASDPSLQWSGGDFGYQEIEPGAAGQPAGETASNGDTPPAVAEAKPEATPAAQVAGETPAPAEAAAEGPPEVDTTAPAKAAPADPATTDDAGQNEAPADDAADAFAARQTWRLAVGIGLAAVVILGASLMLLRRH